MKQHNVQNENPLQHALYLKELELKLKELSLKLREENVRLQEDNLKLEEQALRLAEEQTKRKLNETATTKIPNKHK